MKTKKSVRKVAKRVAVKRVVPVKQSMNMWVVAGILVIVLGGAYFIKTNLYQSPDIFEIGSSVETSNTFSDIFRDGKINAERWSVQKSPKYVSVKEVASDKLVINLNDGAGIKIAPSTTPLALIDGSLQYKGLIKKDKDIYYLTQIDRLAGDTLGKSAAGIMLSVDGGKYVSFGRSYSDGKHYIQISSNASDVVYKSVENADSSVLFRVNRSEAPDGKQTFVFMYKKVTTDESAVWVKFAEYTTAQLKADGRVRLFAYSELVSGQYRDAVARFDRFTLSVENNQGSFMRFQDTFSTTSLNTGVWTAQSESAISFANGNVILPVAAGAKDGKVRVSRLVLKQRLEKDKPATATVTLNKPVVTPADGGTGEVGVILDETADNNEARIRWVGNKLVFVVRGTPEKESITLPSGTTSVQVQLIRRADKYMAKYMVVGDEDNKMKMLGEEKAKKLGNASQLVLYASNVGVDNKFPKVDGSVDEITLRYDN